MIRDPLTWDDLPEFPDDEEIGEVVLGKKKRAQFRALADLREIDGMPKWIRSGAAVRNDLSENSSNATSRSRLRPRHGSKEEHGTKQRPPARTKVAQARRRNGLVLAAKRVSGESRLSGEVGELDHVCRPPRLAEGKGGALPS